MQKIRGPFLQFLLLVILNTPVFSQNNVEISNLYRAVTLQQDTVECFNPSYKQTLVILASNYSCLQCFGEIGNEIAENPIDTSSIEIVLLCRPGIYSLTRRRFMESMNRFITSAHRIIFDLQKVADDFPSKAAKDGLFSAFEIKKTPSILLWNNSKNKIDLLLDYEYLFDNSGNLKIHFDSSFFKLSKDFIKEKGKCQIRKDMFVDKAKNVSLTINSIDQTGVSEGRVIFPSNSNEYVEYFSDAMPGKKWFFSFENSQYSLELVSVNLRSQTFSADIKSANKTHESK